MRLNLSKNPTISEVQSFYRSKQATVLEMTTFFLERAKQIDEQICAFDSFSDQLALQSATKFDQIIQEIGFETALQEYPLIGIPFATKSIVQGDGLIHNASSKILQDFVAPYTCTVLQKVLDAGAILIGVNKMDEFAMGASGETTQYGITKNPFDLERVPGGSSSGGAACVGAGQVVFSLGTDTGGSIRQPAAFCGAMGLKPTYGLVSRFGVIPMSSSLDQVGAITQNIEDNILLTKIMAGEDPKDQTSIDSTKLVANLQNLLSNPTAKKYKIGIPKEFYENLDPIIAQKLEDLKIELTKMGHTLIPVSLPLSKYSVAVYYTLMAVEVASNLERYDGIRYSKQNSKKLLDDILAKLTK